MKGKRWDVRQWRLASATGLSMLLLFGQTAPLPGNPTGGNVVAGSATIGPTGATLTINQSTQNAIINWQQFSIAAGEVTKFIVPDSASATLNRVVGGNPSTIYGTLQSNGTLYLVNPSGIVVGPSGRIDTAGFLASTLDVSNEQFMAGGNLSFSGSSDAAINNAGIVHASSGDVYLIANQVNNTGTLTAPRGIVGLAAGTDVLFQPAGNQHLFVQATGAGTKRATGVTNAGTIRAAAAELKAAGGNPYALAINNTGVITASGYQKINGQVYLTAGTGNIANSGTVSAHTATGDGGVIALVATTGTTTNSGTLNASATAVHGAGGTIETSGESLQIDGTVTAGHGGLWLLDPTDVTIDNGSGVAPDVNVTTLANGLNGGTDEEVQSTGNIDLNAPLTWTSTATLSLVATDDINLNQVLSGTSGTLALQAGGAITDTASLSVNNFILETGSWSQISANLPLFSVGTNFQLQGGTFLRANGGDGSTGNPYQIADVYGLQGLASPSNALLAANAELDNKIDATPTVDWNGGAGFVPIGNGGNYYSGVFNGRNNTINGLTIDRPGTDEVGLFGVASNEVENLSLTDVNVSGNSVVGGLVGSLGNPSSGTASTGVISIVSVSGSVSGQSNYVGGLLGLAHGTAIDQSSSAGTVSGGGFVGGLIGSSLSAISNADSTASVSGSGPVGGLVGENYYGGTVSNSYSTGLVTGTSETGGLVGRNLNVIDNSFWDTQTSGQPTAGVGNGGNIGVTPATTAQLEMQSFILANAPTPPTWDFTNIWTTNGDTSLPQLLAFGGSSQPVPPTTMTTTTQGSPGTGSNSVPPTIVPQNGQIAPLQPTNGTDNAGSQNLGDTGSSIPPPISFAGGGTAKQTGGSANGQLANASSNYDQVGPSDVVQVNDGQLNNANNAEAASEFDLALGPAVRNALATALEASGDAVADFTDTSAPDATNGETVLEGGDVVEMEHDTVKNIPLSKAPKALQDALHNGMPAGAGH